MAVLSHISTLIIALKTDDRRMHTLVIDDLVRMGRQAVDPLLLVLEDANANARAGAVRALGKIGDQRAVPAIVHLLRHDPDAEVRKSAVWALHMGHEQAIPALIDALRDHDEWVRFGAVIVLAKLGGQAVDDLVAHLDDPDPMMRAGVAETLGRIGDMSAADALAQTLDDMNDLVWQQVAVSLGRMRDARAVHALIAIVRDTHSALRTKSVRALGQIRDVRAVDPLLDVLYEENDRWMRLFAIEALGQIDDMRGVEALVDAAYDESRDVRTKAIVTLGTMSSFMARDALVMLVEDEALDADDQQTALFELGKKGDTRAIAGLVEVLLYDPHPDNRIYAALVLGEIEHRDVIDPLINALNDDVADVASHAMHALVRMKDLAAAPLVATLHDALTDTGRLWAVRILGQIGDERSIQALINIALNRTEAWTVREEACDILSQLGYKRP